MQIINIDETQAEKRSGGIFLGTVLVKPLLNESHGCKDLRLDIVEFPQGTRNRLHSHEYDQALYILEGEGIVATEKEERIVRPGMLAFIPAGEKHWHGATDRGPFTHISILRAGKISY